jgi:hypothetical protein
VAYKSKKQSRNAVVSQEVLLHDLLRKAQNNASALAHSYDISGWPDRAWKMIDVAECIRGIAGQLNILARPVEPKPLEAVVGLRLRALLLRTHVRSLASANLTTLVPRLPEGPLTKEILQERYREA